MVIRKAVIPAAGLGTRFLPATKAQPKEMLPIIDTPTIQYVVDEAVRSGIDEILIITGKGKRAIEDHFDRNFELETMLENDLQVSLLNEVRRTADLAHIHYTRQMGLNGLGDAISYARCFTGEEPFAVLLGDTIIDSDVPATRQLIETWQEHASPVLAVERVPRRKVSRYGIVAGRRIAERVHEITDLVEKPTPEKSPSDLAIAGRYILTPAIYDAIEQTPRGRNDEIQLTDALRLLGEQQRILARRIDGIRYDIGNKLDYLKTQVAFGLKREEFAEPFAKFLSDLAAGGGLSAGGGGDAPSKEKEE
jgi:UTP--glucose-1-phosphate uridylyltransferase